MLLKYCTQYASKFGKLSSGHRTGKGQFSFQSQRKAGPKNVQTTALISHASKGMLKILQARLQQYVNWELPDIKAGYRKDRGTRDHIANICWILEKAREYGTTFNFASLTMLKPLTVNHDKLVENSSRDGTIRPCVLSPEKSIRRSRSNS